MLGEAKKTAGSQRTHRAVFFAGTEAYLYQLSHLGPGMFRSVIIRRSVGTVGGHTHCVHLSGPVSKGVGTTWHSMIPTTYLPTYLQ